MMETDDPEAFKLSLAKMLADNPDFMFDLGGSGYLRVRVSPEDVNVDYVQTYLPGEEDETRRDGMVADSYAIRATQ